MISGKGGTGKTSIVGALAALGGDIVLADCDVDAADLHLLLQPEVVSKEDFKALEVAVLDEAKCVQCGRCGENCRFDAITDFKINPLLCEGCAVCTIVCPTDAISMNDKFAGESYISKTRFGTLCHARLYPGEEASGKLVSKVREDARETCEKEGKELIIIDGSPGIGCPVIASIGGVDLALIVTEPTMSGLHDLERILSVTEHFKVKSVVCINKCDVNQAKASEIEEYCKKRGVKVVGKIPYDTVFTKAMIEGKTIIEYSDNRLADVLKSIWLSVEGSLRE